MTEKAEDAMPWKEGKRSRDKGGKTGIGKAANNAWRRKRWERDEKAWEDEGKGVWREGRGAWSWFRAFWVRFWRISHSMVIVFVSSISYIIRSDRFLVGRFIIRRYFLYVMKSYSNIAFSFSVFLCLVDWFVSLWMKQSKFQIKLLQHIPHVTIATFFLSWWYFDRS